MLDPNTLMADERRVLRPTANDHGDILALSASAAITTTELSEAQVGRGRRDVAVALASSRVDA
jgi:hypothetical protein